MSIGDIAEGTEIDAYEVARELEHLCNAGYIAGSIGKLMSGGDPRPWFLESSVLGERGLRVVEAWPREDPYDALLELLDLQINATSDPDARSRLTKLKASVAEVGKATIAGLLVEFAKGGIHF